MRKNILVFLLLLCTVGLLACDSPESRADTVIKKNDFSYEIIYIEEKPYATIREYTGNSDTLIIPNELNEIPVGSINGMECRYPDKIKKVVIPNTVIMAGRYALEDMTSLSEIVVEEGNERYYSIDGVLFEKHGKKRFLIYYPPEKVVDTYTIPDGINDVYLENNHSIKNLVVGGDMTTCAYFSNSSFETVVFNENVKVIDAYAFSDCTMLKKIVLGDNVSHIGEYAFSNCTELSQIVFGQGLRDIYHRAFENCISLKKVRIPASVSSLSSEIFAGCYVQMKCESYLKLQKDGSYAAQVKIRGSKKLQDVDFLGIIAPEKKSYTLKKGDTEKLNTQMYYNEWNDSEGMIATTKALSYKSSNPKVVAISPNGTMRGLKMGEATITVTLKPKTMNGFLSYKVKVKVK